MASSSDESEENDFVVIGTHVPDLEEGQQLKKPTAVQDLTARDKQGRRRFHGAFTGGFSAGYFNTVGTKEGFTPATFLSSRSQKQDKNENQERSEYKPEDFMDEEDFEEHGIAPRKFATVNNYTSDERKRKCQEEAKLISSTSAVDIASKLVDLVVPEQVPIGIKLLCKMGWREGQGLGPRVKKKKPKHVSKSSEPTAAKIYGCAAPPSDHDESDSDDYLPKDFENITFAPKDVCPIPLEPKDNVHGLGYHGLDSKLALPGSHINLFEAPPVRSSKSSKGIRGQAFGVGAFEDEDEDIYAVDNMSNYDITMKLDDEGDNKFGWTAPREHGKQSVPVTYVGKLLEGFCLSSKQLKPKKKYPPPVLPRHFRPQHWFRKKRELGHLPDSLTSDDKGQERKLTAVDRGLMLGELPVMGSVFDLVQKEGRERIEATKEAIAMTQSLNKKAGRLLASRFQQAEEPDLKVHMINLWAPESMLTQKAEESKNSFQSKFKPADLTSIEPKADEADTKGPTAHVPLFQGGLSFQPFRKDPAKQERYDKYLTLVKQGIKDAYAPVASTLMTEWERSREKEEFAKAAKIFRPMSAMMSSRFVRGAMIDDEQEQGPSNSAQSNVSDHAKAAEMKMFGKLTREEFEWHPDQLVCRRFNVPNPYPGSDVVGLPKVKRDKFSVFNFLTFGDYQPSETQEPSAIKETGIAEQEATERTLIPKKKPTMASVFKVLDDPDFDKPTYKAITETKNPATDRRLSESTQQDEEQTEEIDKTQGMDLFRAIFKNSDSEESNDDTPIDEQSKLSSDEEYKTRDSVGEQSMVDNSGIPQTKARDIPTSPTEPATISGNSGKESISSINSASTSSTPNLPDRQRLTSRWGKKSVFSVLDDVDKDSSFIESTESTLSKEASSRLAIPSGTSDGESDGEYGPKLPATLNSSGSQTTEVAHSTSFMKEQQSTDKLKERHKASRKHKKEKKKKSKHKKDKKHKKHRKSKKLKKERESSGSDADTESESDDSPVNDFELLTRLKQVSESGVFFGFKKS
ncbi:unnamed protein product [Lymnaea stagnalis]|uniref:G-patch domain-containing protein n=1 Tax=Lymnaea stagnalis TaxID=6523 RepID=A0AAV2HQZ9_LYMST